MTGLTEPTTDTSYIQQERLCHKTARLAIVCATVLLVVLLASVGGCTHRRDQITATCMESERSAADCALIDCQIWANMGGSASCSVAYP